MGLLGEVRKSSQVSGSAGGADVSSRRISTVSTHGAEPNTIVSSGLATSELGQQFATSAPLSTTGLTSMADQKTTSHLIIGGHDVSAVRKSSVVEESSNQRTAAAVTTQQYSSTSSTQQMMMSSSTQQYGLNTVPQSKMHISTSSGAHEIEAAKSTSVTTQHYTTTTSNTNIPSVTTVNYNAGRMASIREGTATQIIPNAAQISSATIGGQNYSINGTVNSNIYTSSQTVKENKSKTTYTSMDMASGRQQSLHEASNTWISTAIENSLDKASRQEEKTKAMETTVTTSTNTGQRLIYDSNGQLVSVQEAMQNVTGGRVISSYLDYANQKVTEHVVRREAGEMRVISITERVDESRAEIVSERIVEHEVRVPKKIVKEEIIEKVIVVPEKVIVEEIVNEACKVKEKIIEYAHPILVEKVVEVPEYEYVEKIIEVPEKRQEERIKQVEKVVYQDRVREVPRIIPQEKIVEVPDIQYREVPVERIVEVDDWRDEVRVKEVPVPVYVEKPVPNVMEREEAVDINRNIPIPVESEMTQELRIAQIKARYQKMTYPVYLPKFIEVPVAVDLLAQNFQVQSSDFTAQIQGLTRIAASLCDIENLASNIMKADHMAIANELADPSKLVSHFIQTNMSADVGVQEITVGNPLNVSN